jgi:hypothetical protein
MSATPGKGRIDMTVALVPRYARRTISLPRTIAAILIQRLLHMILTLVRRPSLVGLATLLSLVAPGDDLRPITVAVIDRDSGAPVTEFSYQTWYDAPGPKSPFNGDVWKRVESATGTFEIQAPLASRLGIVAKAPDTIGCYPSVNEFVIRSVDNPRRVVVRLRRGITVQGTVRDSRTKNPIPGATVAPVIQMLPVWVQDEDKQVKTGADGRYEARGVGPKLGVCASHPEYVEELAFPQGESTGPNHDVFLKRQITTKVTIRVVDAKGRPLEGVKVLHLEHGRLKSDKDGKLVLQNTGSFVLLTLDKDGFIDHELQFERIVGDSPKPGEFSVVMEPVIELTGRVVAQDGRAVSLYTIAAGPGKLPPGSECVRRDIADRDGRFGVGQVLANGDVEVAGTQTISMTLTAMANRCRGTAADHETQSRTGQWGCVASTHPAEQGTAPRLSADAVWESAGRRPGC